MSLAIMFRAMWRALSWRLLILTPIAMSVASLASLVWLWMFLGGALDHSPHWASLTTLDSSGLASLIKLFGPSVGTGLVPALVTSVMLGIVLSPLLAGAALTVATEDDAPRLGDLLAGAARSYPRLFRMQLAAFVPIAIAAVIANLAQTWAAHAADHVTEEAATHTTSRIAWVVTIVVIVLAQLVIDAGRAKLAVEPARRSAVVALGAGIKLLVKKPVASIVVGLAANAVSLAAAAALLVVRQHLAQTSAGAVAAAFVLGQVAVAVIGWGHAVRLCGLVEIAQD
jgi:hypothetical protein